MKDYEGLCNQKSEVLLESLPLSRGWGTKNPPNWQVYGYFAKNLIYLLQQKLKHWLISNQLLRIDKNDTKKYRKIMSSEHDVAIFSEFLVFMF